MPGVSEPKKSTTPKATKAIEYFAVFVFLVLTPLVLLLGLAAAVKTSGWLAVLLAAVAALLLGGVGLGLRKWVQHADRKVRRYLSVAFLTGGIVAGVYTWRSGWSLGNLVFSGFYFMYLAISSSTKNSNGSETSTTELAQ